MKSDLKLLREAFEAGYRFGKNSVKPCKNYNIIAHCKEEKPVCDVERPLDKPLVGEPDLTKDFYSRKLQELLDKSKAKPDEEDYKKLLSRIYTFLNLDDVNIAWHFSLIRYSDEMADFLNNFIDKEEFNKIAGSNISIDDFAEYIINTKFNKYFC